MPALMQPLEIRDTLTSYWATNFTSVPTIYSNATDKLSDTEKQSPFAMFEIDFSPSQTVGIDGRLNGNRHRGLIVVTIYVPNNSGNRRAYELADEAVRLLSGIRPADSISFDSAWIDDQDNLQEHFAITVLARFKATVG